MSANNQTQIYRYVNIHYSSTRILHLRTFMKCPDGFVISGVHAGLFFTDGSSPMCEECILGIGCIPSDIFECPYTEQVIKVINDSE